MSGMRSSLERFRNDVKNCDYDVIIVSETWLQDQHLVSEILPNGWIIYRKDNDFTNFNNDKRGGGVFIAVKDSLTSTEINIVNDDNSFDIVACEVLVSCKYLFLSAFYIPPNSSITNYNNLANVITDINSKLSGEDDIFIFGDANMPGIQ